jgi:protein-S-isoprenylcysteine O-methyltransferase Ste14
MVWGRRYFAVQALGGAGWWIAVAISPVVKYATLGSLDAVAVAVLDIPLFVVASALAAAGLRAAACVAAGWTLVVAVALAIYATVTTEAGWGVIVMAAAAVASVAALCLVVLGRVPTAWVISGPFAFRPALPRTTSLGHLASTFGQIVVFWGFFLAVVPAALRFLEGRWGLDVAVPGIWVVGLALLVAASALGLWSGVTMSVVGRGTPLPAAMANSLVVAGPYRFIRNPMAVAGFLQGAAVGLLLSSWTVVVYGLLGALLWNYAIRPHEEADLERRFGDDYRRYRAAVRCWVPRLDGWRPAAVSR